MHQASPDTYIKYVIQTSICLSVNIWLCTGLTTCRISFNFTDNIHIVHPIHDTGNGVTGNCQLIKYMHNDPITDFCILVIPEAIF